MIISQAEAMNPRRRTTMEDVCVIHQPGEWDVPDTTFVGVYDGHGGRDMAEFLEHALSYHIAQEWMTNSDDEDATIRLERAFLTTDVHAKALGIESSGATVSICMIQREEQENALNPQIHITTANVGDSRIVLGRRQRRQPKVVKGPSQSLEQEDVHAEGTDGLSWERLTTDHRLDDPSELARIQNAGGFMFKGRVCGVLAVTRSLGDQVLKPFIIGHPAVQSRSIAATTRMEESSIKEDFLIVACDGLWDIMTDSEAVQLVDEYCRDWNDGEKKAQVANYLVNEALRKGTADNVTVVVIWV